MGYSQDMFSDIENITRIDIKKNNRVRIYNTLREHGRLSRAEISHYLDLSQPTVGKNLLDLEESGLVVPSAIRGGTGGRNSQLYEIDENHRVGVAISITNHHIAAVIVNLAGITIAQTRFRYVFARNDAYFRKMGETVTGLIDEAGLKPEQILGVAIVIPALIKPDGSQTYYNQVLHIDDVVSAEEFAQYIPYPCKFAHDTTSAAFAEKWFNPDLTDFMYMMISDSIGGAAILGGAPYLGMENRSCEIAHMKLIRHGKPCYCGGRGCMEPYCSTRVLSDLTGGDLASYFALLGENDPAAAALWNEYTEHLAYSIINVRLLYDCTIIIGGYLGQYIEPYLEQIRARMIQEDPFTNNSDYLNVCKCKNEASATGGALAYIFDFIRSI